jgi:hypothetical protein
MSDANGQVDALAMTGPNGSALRPVIVDEPAAFVSPDPVAVVVRNVAVIDEIVRQIMLPKVHYGKIPGCAKLSLWQPGAEALAQAFQLRPRFEMTYVDNPGGHEGHREVFVTCRLETPDGHVLTEAFGSCTSLESKYRWRSGVPCERCGSTIRPSRFKKGEWYCNAKTGGCGWSGPKPAGASEERRENPDIADELHTVAAMARKRALVLAVKTAVAASDRFTESDKDLEPPRDVERDVAPAARPETASPRTPTRKDWGDEIRRHRERAHLSAEQVAERMDGVGISLGTCSRVDFDKLLAWIDSHEEPFARTASQAKSDDEGDEIAAMCADLHAEGIGEKEAESIVRQLAQGVVEKWEIPSDEELAELRTEVDAYIEKRAFDTRMTS